MKEQIPSGNVDHLPDFSTAGRISFGGSRMVLLDVKNGYWSIRKQLEALVGIELVRIILNRAGVNVGAGFAHEYCARYPDQPARESLESCLRSFQNAGFGKYQCKDFDFPPGTIRIDARDTFESWMMLQHEDNPTSPACSFTAGILEGFVNVIVKRKDIVCAQRSCQALGDPVCTFELLTAAAEGITPVFPSSAFDQLGSQISLLEISRNMFLEVELETLLESILKELNRVVEYDGSTILIINGSHLEVCAYRGKCYPPEMESLRFPLTDPLDSMVIQSRKPVVISDTNNSTPEARAFRSSVSDKYPTPFKHIRSWIGVPLLVKDRIIGELALDHHIPNFYQADHVEMIFAFANQAAVAIENAQLYKRTREAAILEERKRISMDLHDSVSQSFYGISLGAQTVNKILEKEGINEAIRDRLNQPLDNIQELAETGLSEMRSLIFELHPEVLKERGIIKSIEYQAASLKQRHKINIITKLCSEPNLTYETKEAIYRITQEALNNIIKHAEVSEASISLKPSGRQIILEITDNGKGFDPEVNIPGQFGLQNMRERVESLGGKFSLTSASGLGTTVSCLFPF